MSQYLDHMGMLYAAFNVRLGQGQAQNASLEGAIDIIGRVVTYFEVTVNRAKELQNLKQTAVTNGPQGTISAKTLNYVKMIKAKLLHLSDIMAEINPNYMNHILMSVFPFSLFNVSCVPK
jgi:ribosomal protein L17